ncbi:tetratricopeptide repeat protein [Herbaspirillum robiniae]|uniref:Lipopolysaccharide N-acetylglucosaminyl transferase n=1 Tax=Herbaspirillum robiniae TaxID=2014887 RepID=A0ABX2M971_9BURK|nr:hypothetical protein [Herbaspirillum robiniae]NUU04316.1 hypothetical protein [Herbaspirillum robiniae]
MLYKFSIAGISFEIASIALLLHGGAGLAVISGYLALHVVSSALFALAIALVVPERYRHPRVWLLAYLFFFNFFIPVAGLLCAVVALAVGVLWPKDEAEDHFDTTESPEFVTVRRREGSGFSGNRVRAQLGNLATPVDKRLNALVAIQSTPTHASGESLRNLLADPADDVRLLAYGILDGKEKKITQRIVELRSRLETTAESETRAIMHQQVAELYQELIYQNLVQGDLLNYSCAQMREHAKAALAINEEQPGLWFMLVRLELMTGDAGGAAQALQSAYEHGFSRTRLLPYLAELSYLERDYEQVRKLFIEMAYNPSVSSNPQLHRFWRHGRRTIADRPDANRGPA